MLLLWSRRYLCPFFVMAVLVVGDMCGDASCVCDSDSLLQITKPLSPRTMNITCQLSEFSQDALVTTNDVMTFVGQPDDFVMCEEAGGITHYIVAREDDLPLGTLRGAWIFGTFEETIAPARNTTSSVPLPPWEEDGSPAWQLVRFVKSKAPPHSVSSLLPPDDVSPPPTNQSASSVSINSAAASVPTLDGAATDNWVMRAEVYCSGNWRKDWAKRAVKPLAACKASCQASLACGAIAFGSYRGVDNNCVLCTPSTDRETLHPRKLAIPSYMLRNWTGDPFPFSNRLPPPPDKFTLKEHLEEMREDMVEEINETTTYVKYEGWKAYGGTYCSGPRWDENFAARMAKSLPDCKASCEVDDACLGFTYIFLRLKLPNCIPCTSSLGLTWKESKWTTTYIKPQLRWGIRERTYCSENWRTADWANRTVQPLSTCKASCEASSTCNAITFGTWRGVKNNCVFCTGTGWKQASWTTTFVKETTTTTTRKYMDILMVICEFTDYKPDYVNEHTALAELFGSFLPVIRYLYESLGVKEPWGADRHVTNDQATLNDVILVESNNHIVLSPERSKVVTVQMNVAWGHVRGCPHLKIAERAMRQVKKQHPGVDPDSYSFRELFIPASPSGGCKWDGLANVDCGQPRHLPKPGGCLAWYRLNHRFTRIHELGHNLGLSHAGGRSGSVWTEYGDTWASMGNSYGHAMFTASDRHHLGWLADGQGEVLEWKVSNPTNVFTLSEAHAPPRQPDAQALAVKVACPTCRARVPRYARQVGGFLWVDYTRKNEYEGAIVIRLQRASGSFDTKGSEEWARLNTPGESFKAEGVAIKFCSREVETHITHIVRVAIGDSMFATNVACAPHITNASGHGGQKAGEVGSATWIR